MKIEIPDNPIPQKRSRSKMITGHSFAIHYDSQSKQKENVRWIIRNSTERTYCLRVDPLCVEMTFYLPYPKKLDTSEVNAIEWNFLDYIAKPDIDNMAKFYLDCMNGLVYEDDCQVKNLILKKTYSKNPRTVIEIKEIQYITMNRQVQNILSQFSPEELFQFLKQNHKLYEDLKRYENVEISLLEDDAIFRKILSETASILKRYSKIMLKISKMGD